jgi:hypothetical protein
VSDCGVDDHRGDRERLERKRHRLTRPLVVRRANMRQNKGAFGFT